MAEYTTKKCPECGQQLRFPKNIGGMLMACPSCGQKFSSDFKLGNAKGKAPQGIVITVFEMPYKVVSSIARFFLSR